MQKLLPIVGGLNAYLAAPEALVTEASRRCPFCTTAHRLRLHGRYERFVLLPGHHDAARIPVQRLLCALVGRTVSLLPDFCIPGRQHGPGILGAFLARYAEDCYPLRAALRAAGREAAAHSVAQSLRDGFLARAGPIRTYVASIHARVTELQLEVSGLRRTVGALLAELRRGFADAASALLHHGVGLHARQRIGFA